MKCEGLDSGPSVLEYISAVGEQKKDVVIKGDVKPQTQGTGGEDEKKHRDPVRFVPFPVL